ncbi:MAG: hypothetical protein AAGA90_18115 [Actinomycetota bacterium]
MNLWNILEALVRRWRIAIPMTILAVAVVFRVYSAIEPTYVAYGEALLTTPATDDGSNPILEGSGGLSTLAQAGGAVLLSAEEYDALLNDGFSEYEISVSARDPIVGFSAYDTSALRAEQTVSRVITRFDEILEELQLQSGANEDFIASSVVLQPPSSFVEASSRIRTTLVAAVASILAVLVVTLSWDELRRSRTPAAAPAGQRAPAQPAPEPVRARREEVEPEYYDEPEPVRERAPARAKRQQPSRPPRDSSRWGRRGENDDDLETEAAG